jgi:hypothetical protein
VVEATCPADPNRPTPNRVTFYELAVRVNRTGPGDGTFTALQVDYVSSGRPGQLTIPWALKLCGPAHRTNESCGNPPDATRGVGPPQP